MLIKCKSCGAEYELAQLNIPTSGMEFECSECGAKWLQFPLGEKVNPESTHIIDENNIIEPSVLSGKEAQKPKDADGLEPSISALARQEILAQKQTAKDRHFEWIVHKNQSSEQGQSLKPKSFELLTNPSGNTHIENQILDVDENLLAKPKFGDIDAETTDEIINPELVQRIKEVEKVQHTSIEVEDHEEVSDENKSKRFKYIMILLLIILLSGFFWSETIIKYLPGSEPVFDTLKDNIASLTAFLKKLFL